MVVLGEGLMVEAEGSPIIPEKEDSQEAIIHLVRIHPAVLQAGKVAAAGQAAKARTAMEEAIQATEEAIVLEEDLGDVY